jgi:hypothetical protein
MFVNHTVVHCFRGALLFLLAAVGVAIFQFARGY